MTKELAIIILKSLVEYYNDKNEDSYVGFDGEDNESIDMAIKVLEQQPCENCVSREEVIRIIKDHPRIVGDRSILVQKVVELPPATSSYNSIKTELTDCISREAVMKLLEKEDWADTVEGVLALPPATPQRKRGKWLWELAPNGWANHICSECGFKENTDIHVKLNWQFCPKCGTRMIDIKKSEDAE